jgi:amino acid adenylation domain-containing protein
MTETMEGYALSPQQQRLWNLQQGEPGLPYRAQCVLRVAGRFDPQRFTTALEQVVQRHEILRTTFHSVPGMTFPVQVIGQSRPPLCQSEDWRGLSAPAQAAQRTALWQQAWQQPLDLAHGPLLRLTIARLASTQHLILITLPALCADLTTLSNLAHDLSRAYADDMHDETYAEAPTQYADFSAWHHTLLTAEAGEAAYWCQHMAAELLPVKHPWEALFSQRVGFTPDGVPIALAPDLADRIEALARQYHTSAAVFLLACWTLLLWRHLGQADVLVGMACDGRNYAPLTGALGLFARYLPVRCALQERLAFTTLLARLHDATHEAAQQQEYFSWEGVGLQGGVDSAPAFFPWCFAYVEAPTIYAGAAVSWTMERLEACTERFTVQLTCVRQADTLCLTLHYNAQVLQSAALTLLAEQFHTLLTSASQHPEAAIDQLNLLSAAERQRVVVTFNQTRVPYPDQPCLQQLFEAQVERAPDSLAVVYAEQSLTYAALNARANQLAHSLQKRGVGPQTRVGLCVDRSLDMIVGMLGILKAGAAYVPLDPAYPRERLAFMLADVQASLLLTQERLLPGLPRQDLDVLCLDSGWSAVAREPATNPASAVTPAHLAYVIYTSGSTGQPKGVLVTHSNVVHSTRARLLYYPTPVVGFLLLSSVAFDSSVAGLFGTLCQGGTLILPGAGQQGDLPHLCGLITRHQVSHVLSLPSLYALLLEQASPLQLRTLHTVVVAGEPCPRALVARHHACLPAVLLCNEYGPTEGTVWSTVYQCARQDIGAAVPIGRPIANMQIYVLDPHMQPLPSGVPGELYIGGAGVTVGYWQRPALTAERFLPHPFSALPGARLYKSGDVGRYRPDGTLEFLGRTDQQVKIRGFRIELGEIETVLKQHPAILEAVVMARDQGPPRRPGVPNAVSEVDTALLVARLLAHGESAATILDAIETLSDHDAAWLLEHDTPLPT